MMATGASQEGPKAHASKSAAATTAGMNGTSGSGSKEAGSPGDGDAADGRPEGLLRSLGAMLQTQEVQFLLVVLVVVDFLSAFYLVFAEAKGWSNAFIKVVEYQSGMALLAFTLELALLLVAFRGEVFAHIGYSLDIGLVSVMFYGVLTAAPWAAAARLLNVLRFWRVVRMVNASLLAAEQAHARTRAELAASNERIEALKLKTKRADLAHKREADKNKRLEQNFRAQRDELDTLREALQIAAHTMAKVQGLEGIADLMGEQDQLELAKAAQEESDEDSPESDEDDGLRRAQRRPMSKQSELDGEQAQQAAKSRPRPASFAAVPELGEDSEDDDDVDDDAGFEDSESGPETNELESAGRAFASASKVRSAVQRDEQDGDNAERDVEEHKEMGAQAKMRGGRDGPSDRRQLQEQLRQRLPL